MLTKPDAWASISQGEICLSLDASGEFGGLTKVSPAHDSQVTSRDKHGLVGRKVGRSASVNTHVSARVTPSRQPTRGKLGNAKIALGGEKLAAVGRAMVMQRRC